MNNFVCETRPLLKLKGLRAEHALTQDECAKLLGVTTATYNRKENGVTPFDVREVNVILHTFSAKYEDIFMSEWE